MRDPGLRSQYRTEILVGAFIVAALIALVLGVAWISGARPGGGGLWLYAVTPEAAAVTEGTRVSLLGVDVGSVERIELRQEDVVLHLRVSHRGVLPRDTRGDIRPSGFLGTMEVALIPGGSAAPLTDGDTIAAGATAGLQDVAGKLGDQAAEILEQARSLLSDETIRNVQSGAASFSEGMGRIQGLLRDEVDELETLIEGLSAASAELAKATSGPHLERTVSQLDTLTARLAAASDDLDASSRSLSSILAKIDSGEGSLGLMVNDPELYDRLTAASENIQAATEEIALLSKDVRERPDRYLKGVKFSVF